MPNETDKEINDQYQANNDGAIPLNHLLPVTHIPAYDGTQKGIGNDVTIKLSGAGAVHGHIIGSHNDKVIDDTVRGQPLTIGAISVSLAATGSSYRPGMDSTLAGGDFTTAAVINIDSIGTIQGQNQTNFSGGEITGTFTPGSGYETSDVITLSDGTVITVNATNIGAITGFTITTSSTSGSGTNWPNLTQSSTSGGGTGFSMVLDDSNQTAFGVTVIIAGSYTVVPSNPVAQDGSTSPFGGTGATFTVNFG